MTASSDAVTPAGAHRPSSRAAERWAPGLVGWFGYRLLRRAAVIGLDDGPGFVLAGVQDHLGLGVLEVVQGVALDPLPLHLDHARLGPLSVFAKRDVADNRLERGLVHVVGDRLLVGAVGRGDRIPQYLQIGVTERRQVPAERIDALSGGLYLVRLEEIGDAREIHRLRRNPPIVVDDAVQFGAELQLHRGELQPDHAAAKEAGLEADLGRGAQHAD